jgi:hypothetical protein
LLAQPFTLPIEQRESAVRVEPATRFSLRLGAPSERGSDSAHHFGSLLLLREGVERVQDTFDPLITLQVAHAAASRLQTSLPPCWTLRRGPELLCLRRLSKLRERRSLLYPRGDF